MRQRARRDVKGVGDDGLSMCVEFIPVDESLIWIIIQFHYKKSMSAI
jgi:hypothetical protein